MKYYLNKKIKYYGIITHSNRCRANRLETCSELDPIRQPEKQGFCETLPEYYRDRYCDFWGSFHYQGGNFDIPLIILE